MISRFFHRGRIASGKPLPYEEAKAIAGGKDAGLRRALAKREDLRPELLYYMAEDTDAEVRGRVAANPATPIQASHLLAHDQEESVRGQLADKIARLAPGLTASEQDKARRLTYEVLETLARDQVVRVRQILAEALKDVAHAPPEVVRHLARDAELVVAGPVLEFSPVLTDEDLLEIIAESPIQGALSAISRRSQVRSRVADAIAASDDVEAIATLLANPSAQIREETLDGLIERAPAIESWHGPLVRRPYLPAKAARRLARFVASNLLDVLRRRDDLPEEVIRTVEEVVRRRLDEGESEAPPAGASPRRPPKSEGETPLDEAALTAALNTGDRRFVCAGLAVLVGMTPEHVERIVSTHSAKGMVALTWQAKLSPAFATKVQLQLARLPASAVLHPKGDQFPLSNSELEWQIEFFGSLAG